MVQGTGSSTTGVRKSRLALLLLAAKEISIEVSQPSAVISALANNFALLDYRHSLDGRHYEIADTRKLK